MTTLPARLRSLSAVSLYVAAASSCVAAAGPATETDPEPDGADSSITDAADAPEAETHTDTGPGGTDSNSPDGGDPSEVGDFGPDAEEGGTSDTNDAPDSSGDGGPGDALPELPGDTGDVPSADVSPVDGAGADADPGCPPGTVCNPIRVDVFPFTDARDTGAPAADDWDAYSCAPATSEAGGEFVYRLTIPNRGVLLAALDDVSGDGIDVDVHLLGSAAPDDCRARANIAWGALVEPGTLWVAVDTWANSAGDEFPGAYTLTLRFVSFGDGPCAMTETDLRMVWSACDPAIDCYEATAGDGRTYRYLRTPAFGPVVKEAHLVTVGDGFGGSWPVSFTDGIENHYSVSESATGYAMSRTEPWAPAGEGGSEYGQGSYGRALPVVDEAWYVNMYWRDRPDPGTRMIVINPENGRAVVAAGGYETGPGANTAIGGASEEIHHHLGTSHRDDLVFGFAIDETLPLGPIDCGEE